MWAGQTPAVVAASDRAGQVQDGRVARDGESARTLVCSKPGMSVGGRGDTSGKVCPPVCQGEGSRQACAAAKEAAALRFRLGPRRPGSRDPAGAPVWSRQGGGHARERSIHPRAASELAVEKFEEKKESVAGKSLPALSKFVEWRPWGRRSMRTERACGRDTNTRSPGQNGCWSRGAGTTSFREPKAADSPPRPGSRELGEWWQPTAACGAASGRLLRLHVKRTADDAPRRIIVEYPLPG